LSAEELKEAGAFCRVLSLHFANELVGDIRPHVITNVNQGKRTGVLMKTSVEECTNSGNKAFVTAFMETQMFSVWSDEVIRDKIERMI
jgi:predicted transcriptional regulator